MEILTRPGQDFRQERSSPWQSGILTDNVKEIQKHFERRILGRGIGSMTIRTKLWLTNTLAFVCITLVTMLAISYFVDRIVRERTIAELTNSSEDISNMIQAILKTSIVSSLQAQAEDALESVRGYQQRASRGEL